MLWCQVAWGELYRHWLAMSHVCRSVREPLALTCRIHYTPTTRPWLRPVSVSAYSSSSLVALPGGPGLPTPPASVRGTARLGLIAASCCPSSARPGRPPAPHSPPRRVALSLEIIYSSLHADHRRPWPSFFYRSSGGRSGAGSLSPAGGAAAWRCTPASARLAPATRKCWSCGRSRCFIYTVVYRRCQLLFGPLVRLLHNAVFCI